jgi:hypothetical protein
MQVNATIGPDNQLSFQAGHAGSIPVTRSTWPVYLDQRTCTTAPTSRPD